MTILLHVNDGYAFVRCPECRRKVALAANGDGLLRLDLHQAAHEEALCDASGRELGRLAGFQNVGADRAVGVATT